MQTQTRYTSTGSMKASSSRYALDLDLLQFAKDLPPPSYDDSETLSSPFYTSSFGITSSASASVYTISQLSLSGTSLVSGQLSLRRLPDVPALSRGRKVSKRRPLPPIPSHPLSISSTPVTASDKSIVPDTSTSVLSKKTSRYSVAVSVAFSEEAIDSETCLSRKERFSLIPGSDELVELMDAIDNGGSSSPSGSSIRTVKHDARRVVDSGVSFLSMNVVQEEEDEDNNKRHSSIQSLSMWTLSQSQIVPETSNPKQSRQITKTVPENDDAYVYTARTIPTSPTRRPARSASRPVTAPEGYVSPVFPKRPDCRQRSYSLAVPQISPISDNPIPYTRRADISTNDARTGTGTGGEGHRQSTASICLKSLQEIPRFLLRRSTVMSASHSTTKHRVTESLPNISTPVLLEEIQYPRRKLRKRKASDGSLLASISQFSLISSCPMINALSKRPAKVRRESQTFWIE